MSPATVNDSDLVALLQNSQLLVVDDLSTNREILSGMLHNAGYTNLLQAETGEEALEQIRSNRPDLVLLDLMLPGISGFEVCETLRKEPEFRDLPIIAQTALADVEARTRVFAVGATDLIVKPLNMAEVLGRVRVHLTNRLLMSDMRQYRERVSAELDLARSMQHALIPAPETLAHVKESHGLTLFGHFEPSSEMGGDIWGFRPLSDGRIALYVVDFSGHGVSAAINTFRLHTILLGGFSDDMAPHEFLQEMGQTLRELLPIGQFATMILALIDPAAGEIRYAAAGSTDPMLVLKEGSELVMGSGRGYLLGAMSNPEYEEKVLPFPEGATLLLYSDALIEMEDDDGGTLEPEEVAEIVQSHAQDSVETMAGAVLARFKKGRSQVLADDLTLVAVRNGIA